MINDIKQAEKPDGADTKPFQTLTKQTIGISTLLGQPKYRALCSRDQETDQKLFSILQRLNYTRNSLHFLNIEYIASGGLSVDNFVFLRDYVTSHIDAPANKIIDEGKGDLEIGKAEIDHLLDSEFDDHQFHRSQ